jgi:hypothetical protein
MVLQADKGIDIQEASGISFKNIRVISGNKAVVDISTAIIFRLTRSLIKMAVKCCFV